MSPCSSCIHYRSVTGSLHPVESWCTISGEWLSARDVWHNNPEAHTGVWGVKTNNIPDCKFTMSTREVWEFDEWRASKMTLYYRENRGGYKSFSSDPRNDYWRDAFYEEQEVAFKNSERFWPGNDLAHFAQQKPLTIAAKLEPQS